MVRQYSLRPEVRWPRWLEDCRPRSIPPMNRPGATPSSGGSSTLPKCQVSSIKSVRNFNIRTGTRLRASSSIRLTRRFPKATFAQISDRKDWGLNADWEFAVGDSEARLSGYGPRVRKLHSEAST